jgi:hypothetical protein
VVTVVETDPPAQGIVPDVGEIETPVGIVAVTVYWGVRVVGAELETEM